MPVWFGRAIVVALVGAIGVVGSGGILAAPEAASGVRASGGARIDSEECRLLNDINRFRRTHDLKPLDLGRDLNEAADHHSQDMARRDYFDHDLGGGTSWSDNIRDFGYKGNPIGENILAGTSGAGKAFKEWEKSRGHRENMLRGSFESIGIGRAFEKKSEYGWYWTTTFGGRVENKVNCG